MINGKYRQVMLSARELNTENMPNRSWVNERLTFTHGYGLTLGPVNQVTTEGLPVLFIRDLPPVSTVESAGRRAEHLLRRALEQLRDRQDETAGVPLPARRRQRHDDVHGHGRRADRRLLAAAAVRAAVRRRRTSSSRTRSRPRAASCSTGRSRERVQTLAPFLTFDADPYPVVTGGRLLLDPGRVHDDRQLSVLDADDDARRRRSTTSATR